MTEPIWYRPERVHPTLDGTIRTDAVIIGGGLTGLLTALRLQEQGVRCVVLEANTVGSGQSGGTTAKVTIQHGLYWAKLAARIGRDAARIYALAQQAAVDDYARLAREPECYEELPSMLYTMGSTAPLREEAAFLAWCGLPAKFVTSGALPCTGAVRLERQAQLEPGRLMAALAERVTVYEHSRVLRVSDDGVETIGGAVRAGMVVFADHYPMRSLRYSMRLHQSRAEAMLLDAPAPSEMYLAADDAAPNVRPYNGRVLISGGSRRTGTSAAVTLRQMAARWYPGARVLARWAAQDTMTPDSLPYIGRFSPSKKHWYAATGYNGWGMSTAMLAAEILTAQMTGHTHPAAEIVSPARAVPVGPVLQESAVSLKNELTPGGPRCTHLGCHLQQNEADGSWECPCHGSRFDAAGHLLDGPAQRDTRVSR